jgi:hypothetical protein
MPPITIESLGADNARGEEFTLTVTIATPAGDPASSSPESAAPPRAAVVVVSWRTAHFHGPEAHPDGWMPFALADFGLEGLRCLFDSRGAEGTGRATLAIPGFRHADHGKKRRIRVHLLVDGIPVESARLKRKTRKPKA